MESKPFRECATDSIYCPHCRAPKSKSTFYDHYENLNYRKSFIFPDNQNVPHQWKEAFEKYQNFMARKKFQNKVEAPIAPMKTKLPSQPFKEKVVKEQILNLDQEDIPFYESDDELPEVSQEYSQIEMAEVEGIELDPPSYLDDNFLLIREALEKEKYGNIQTKEQMEGFILGFSFLILWWQYCYKLSIASIETMLIIISSLIGFLCPPLQQLFPKSFFLLNKVFNPIRKAIAKESIVCPKCNHVYNFEDAVISDINGKVIGSKNCGNYIYKGIQCLEPLLKHENNKWKGRKFYYSIDLLHLLAINFKNPDFRKQINLWRTRESNGDDVYDFKLWKEHSESGKILHYEDNLALMICFDFVNPFGKQSTTKYSVGVISMVILNLPKDIRYKKDNMFILGVVPGPKEPKLHLNGFANLLIEQLRQLEEGCFFDGIVVRAILFCVTGDIPALRKILAFAGFGTHKACSKCKKNCSHLQGWSGTLASTPRKEMELESASNYYANSVQNQEQDKLHIQKYFARYSPFYSLKYFNVLRQHTIDPMHNLFLGVTKAHFKYLLTILSEKKLKILDSRIELIQKHLPVGLGRLPTQIGKFYYSMKAEQFLNFALYISIVALQNLLPKKHYLCWYMLVFALRKFSSYQMNQKIAEEGHEAYIRYLDLFRDLAGVENITINFHLVLHLKELLLDFGPIHVFWCFSFERYNGMLQGFPTNGLQLEKQIFNRLLLNLINSPLLKNHIIHVPHTFLQIIENKKAQDNKLMFCRRGTAVPKINQKVLGNEKLDGRFLGIGQQSSLSPPEFKLLQQFLNSIGRINNIITIYSRFVIGSTIIKSHLYKKSNPTGISFRLQNSKRYGTVKYFFEITCKKISYKLAVVEVSSLITTKDYFSSISNRKIIMILPISRIENLCALVPLSKTSKAVIEFQPF